MAFPWEDINDNIVNFSLVVNDMFNTEEEKDVTWVYKDKDGVLRTVTMPNVAKIAKQLNSVSISESEVDS